MSVDHPDAEDDRRTQLPTWRQHFPIDSSLEASRSRREFIGGLTLTGGAIACGNAVAPHLVPANSEARWQSAEPLSLDTKLSALTVGETLHFHYPDHRSPCLLVKLDESNFVAYAQKCTHLACPVIPKWTKTASTARAITARSTCKPASPQRAPPEKHSRAF